MGGGGVGGVVGLGERDGGERTWTWMWMCMRIGKERGAGLGRWVVHAADHYGTSGGTQRPSRWCEGAATGQAARMAGAAGVSVAHAAGAHLVASPPSPAAGKPVPSSEFNDMVSFSELRVATVRRGKKNGGTL